MTTSTEAFTNTQLGTELTVEEILDGFELLDDWEERYAYIIDLGKKLPPFPDEERREENYVHGCQSQVWLIHHMDPETGRLYLLIDSDAMIVRGLAAIIMTAFNARTPGELLKGRHRVDLPGAGPDASHLPTRGNGLRAMVGRIQNVAQAEAA